MAQKNHDFGIKLSAEQGDLHFAQQIASTRDAATGGVIPGTKWLEIVNAQDVDILSLEAWAIDRKNTRVDTKYKKKISKDLGYALWKFDEIGFRAVKIGINWVNSDKTTGSFEYAVNKNFVWTGFLGVLGTFDDEVSYLIWSPD